MVKHSFIEMHQNVIEMNKSNYTVFIFNQKTINLFSISIVMIEIIDYKSTG